MPVRGSAGLGAGHRPRHHPAGVEYLRQLRRAEPGALQRHRGPAFQVVVDFAHNPDGVRGSARSRRHRPSRGTACCAASTSAADTPPISRRWRRTWLVASTSSSSVVTRAGRTLLRVRRRDPAGAMVARSRALLLEQGVDPDRITGEVDRRRLSGARWTRRAPVTWWFCWPTTMKYAASSTSGGPASAGEQSAEIRTG